jgi:hypothetical protein
MQILNKNVPFIINDVEDHKNIKQLLLHQIDEMGRYSFKNNSQSLSNTDWHLAENAERYYFTVFNNLVQKTNAKLSKTLNVKLQLGNYWFQQYEYMDYHNWHHHNNCLYSNVYYLELPEESSKTSFKLMDDEFDVDVKEGQILTFPSCFLHCSKPNLSNKRKTVISYNIISVE